MNRFATAVGLLSVCCCLVTGFLLPGNLQGSFRASIRPSSPLWQSTTIQPEATATGQAQSSLPPNWESAVDASSGRTYYYSRDTGETSWTPPPPPPPVPSTWESAVDPSSGKTYYYNRDTGETSWSAPSNHVEETPKITNEVENEDRKIEEPKQSTAKKEKGPQDEALYNAAKQLDVTTVSSLLERGLEMDEKTTNAAFWAVVKAVDRAEEEDQPLSADVPRMLHHVFDADMRHLLSREKITKNITCMQPASEGLSTEGMNYIFDDAAHKDLTLKEGRKCEDGSCCDACSRNIFPTFATDYESNLERFTEMASFTFNNLEYVRSGTILHFTRLIERVRRTIAHEYGLPLKTILPLQAYSRKYVAGTTQQGGGGGEGDFVILHTDEATHTGYHYSCVLYLSTQGEDFEGGDFIFNDPADESEESKEEDDEEGPISPLVLEEQIRQAGRKLTPFSPTRGAAVIFSSGWENMHEVHKITSGTRYAVPAFFTTCPVPEQAYEQMHVGKPKTDEDIADEWLHLLLAHRQETPEQAVGRVKELLMKWHYICAPLSEH